MRYPRFVLLAFCLALSASTCLGQGFTVAANPSSAIIYPGEQGVAVTVTVNAGAYTGPVTITMFGLPSGVTAAPLVLAGSSSGTLLLSASLSAGQEGFSPLYDSANTSWTAPVTLLAAAGASLSTAQFFLTVSISNPAFVPASGSINLPIVNINTNGVAVISKTTDVAGAITITSADGQTTYLPNSSDTDNTATFHVHGNSTAGMPKLPYHIKLNTSVDLLNAMGLNC
jgi:hypothetical protein